MYNRLADPATDTWIPPERWESAARYSNHVLAVRDALEQQLSCHRWMRSAPGGMSQRCRFMSKRKQCGRQIVVMLQRGQRWYGYCDDDAHLFGRHWEPETGRLLDAYLVHRNDAPVS